MNVEVYIDKITFYWVSFLLLLPFIFTYYLKTIKKDRDLYWFIYEDGDSKFDFDFLNKVIVQLLVVYFALFTFMNVVYFVFEGKWVSDTSFLTSRSFVIIGAVTYIIELIKKSSAILYDQKQKKIKINQRDTTPNTTENTI